jgi:hypothetical protein
MGGEGTNTESSGRITCGITANTLQLQTVAFVRGQLAAWRDDPTRKKEEAERELNSQLSRFLDLTAKHIFPMVGFQREEPQATNRAVDVAALPNDPVTINGVLYAPYTPILVIECKRLPAPSDQREKEYVTGVDPNKKTGGIQRFKLGLHGGKLPIAAMVGYVQDGAVTEWHPRINKWISELYGTTADGCTWSMDDRLGPLDEDVQTGVSQCQSKHQRSGSATETIELYHLWITMG